MLSANQIRRQFLDYFGQNDHDVVASAPLVPRNDPSLLFTSAGMVPFKNLFTGAETRAKPRATTSQKCLRAGGKHNDLENVGHTARHHTFFEMLGNFSFGDYFKERAIELAWNLITRDYGIDREKLLVTVYAEDEDAAGLWRKIAGLPDSKIIRIATSDNFWAMGDTGPCGPCSEIFYDHGAHLYGGPPGSPEEDGDRFVEIWNLVFMQFEQRGPGDRAPLPRPSIDTGMGLERISAVMQGVSDNYDTDLLRGLILASAEASGQEADGPHKVSHRVIADHLRASCFLLAEGVLPSNEGRGYVLRRIMRRAMRHAHIMGCRDPLMWRLAPSLIGAMGGDYPELGRAEALIVETLRREETRFKEMLERGLRLLADETAKLAPSAALSGDVAFTLYDTYGFPLDLTQDVLRGQNRTVDQAGFDAAMGRQKAAARAAWSGSGEAATDRIWFDLRQEFGATEFLGYQAEKAEGHVLALVVDGKRVEKAEAGTSVSIITNQTPFYGESGGQMGDAGEIIGPNGHATIVDTSKYVGDLIVHKGTIAGGAISVGDGLALNVDHQRRTQLRANHSATHLLHAALRGQLGDHVAQKGSLVAPDRLRFDFSHPNAVSPEELTAIETKVNAQIRLNAPASTRLMTPDEAVEAGALALFGEKYGDEVRVIAMGGEEGMPYSVELCGGTHVSRVGDIGLLKIVGEGAVASGVRRIEAMTGAAALAWVAERERLLETAAAAAKTGVADLPARVAALVEDRRRLERELLEARKAAASGGGGQGAVDKTVAGVTFASRRVVGVPARELRGMAETLIKQIGPGVVALVAADEGKASLVVAVSSDLTARFSAVDLVRAGAKAVGGQGGGGRPDMAQAGGPDVDKLDDALVAIEAALG